MHLGAGQVRECGARGERAAGQRGVSDAEVKTAVHITQHEVRNDRVRLKSIAIQVQDCVCGSAGCARGQSRLQFAVRSLVNSAAWANKL